MKAKMSDTLKEILDCDGDAKKLREALDIMGDLDINEITIKVKGKSWTIKKVKRRL